MQNVKFLIIFTFSLVFFHNGVGAQTLCPPNEPCAANECYDLSENEAMDIMTAQLSVFGDPPYVWEVDKIGHGLICLDFCTPGTLMVAPGKFNKGKCTYRVTNNDPVNMIGDCTTIVLKRRD